MTSIDPWSAIRLSLLVAAYATALGFPVAVGLGFVMARWEFPGKALVGALLLAPLVLPPVVTGLLLLEAFGQNAALGKFFVALGLPIAFSLAGVVLAALVVGLPLFVVVARGAFEAVDPRYEEVSLSLGVPPFSTFLRVTLPLALPGLVAGAVLAFARALGEFGATCVLAGNMEGRTRTISLAVYSLLDLPGGESRAAPLVAASLGISVMALAGYELLGRWQKRRLELYRGAGLGR